MKLKHCSVHGIFRKSPLRYWNGVKWVYANLKKWNGNEWVECTQKPLSDFFLSDTHGCLVEPNGELVRHYNSTYFKSPYVYYHGNKLSYRVLNNYKNSSKPWTMDIQVWNPWTEQLIMTKNIDHVNPEDYSSYPATHFDSSISITNNKIFIFYTTLYSSWGNAGGVYVTCLDLNLNIISQSDCTSILDKTGVPNYHLNRHYITMRDNEYIMYDYYFKSSNRSYSSVTINTNTGVCKYLDREYVSSKYDYTDLEKLGYLFRFAKYTGSLPIYEWSMHIFANNMINEYSTINTKEYPEVFLRGGNILSTIAEEFKYGGMQKKLNNKILYGLLRLKDTMNFIDGAVFSINTVLSSENYHITPLYDSSANYLTFRKMWGNPSLGYTIYESMNGINLANKILNYDPARNKLTFRHLPNGQTLMYFDNDIFNFTQKNDKFYISYYGTQIKAFAGGITEPYGCNKEIIE